MAASFTNSRGNIEVSIKATRSSETANANLGLVAHRLTELLNEFDTDGEGAEAVAVEYGFRRKYY